MPCLITALTRSAIEKITRKKQQNKQKKFTAETRYLNLKGPNNNLKLQSEKP